MGIRDERYAGAYAGSENGESRVTPGLKPVESGSRVDDRLANGLKRASQVCRQHVVRADQVFGHPQIMVRQAQPQRGKAEKVQHPAQRHVPPGVAVPLGQDQHDPAL